jgi:hypothetical protein
MNTIKTIIAAIALSAGLSVAAHAETLKPLQGVSFHTDAKDAVAYFLSENRTCKLVLTMADKDAQPTRFEAAIPGGESASHELTDGKALEFACQADAQTMTIKMATTVAAN